MGEQASALCQEQPTTALLEEVALLAVGELGGDAVYSRLAQLAAQAFALEEVLVVLVDRPSGRQQVVAVYPPGRPGAEHLMAQVGCRLRDLADSRVGVVVCKGRTVAPASTEGAHRAVKVPVTLAVPLRRGASESLILCGRRRRGFSAEELRQIVRLGQAASRLFEERTTGRPSDGTGDRRGQATALPSSPRTPPDAADAMATLTSLYRCVAHDVNNALTAIVGQGQVLLEELGRAHASSQGALATEWLGEQRERVRVVLDRALALMSTVRALQEYLALQPLVPTERVDLAQLARQAAELTSCVWEAEAAARGCSIDLRCEAEEPVPVNGVPEQLRKALIHLIFNALQAVETRGGRILVRVALEDRGMGPQAVCEVEDDGEGMDEEVLRKARKPFFTTRPDRCRGLGLTLADSIIRQHGGSLEILSVPGLGTRVKLCLPLAGEKAG